MLDCYTHFALQGYEGSFHHDALVQFLDKDISGDSLMCCPTFNDVIAETKKDSSVLGIMAIENTTAGTILRNHDLLHESGLHIVGETYLHARMHLLTNPETTISYIKEIYSHRIAIQQCLSFLQSYQWRIVELEDTAYSAKYVREANAQTLAAVGSAKAAELYDLTILKADIHDYKMNCTRFLMLSSKPHEVIERTGNKASIRFTTHHSKGKLAKVLACFERHNLNLTKLQSFPIPNTPFQYTFYADIVFACQDDLHNALENARPLFLHLSIYGIYQNGETNSNC